MPDPNAPGSADHRFALRLLGGIVAAWLLVLLLVLQAARLPPEGSGTVIAVFPPRFGADRSFAAASAAEARLVSLSWFDNVLVLDDPDPGLAGRLERQGALAVFRNVSFAGVSFAGCVGAPLP